MDRSTGNVLSRVGAALATCAIVAAASPAVAADKKCQLVELVELPITMNNLRPTIPAMINGREAKFILDSGAFYSMMSAATATEYGLKSHPYFGLRVQGIGGFTEAAVTTVHEFRIAGGVLKNVEFLVGGGDFGNAGLLGQNFLEKFDVEYDFAHGAIRLFRTEHCEKSTLAYWLTAGEQFSMMPIQKIDAATPHTVGVAYLNGQEIRVVFDTGAPTSMLTTKAAARAGIKPDSQGVVASGYATGIGQNGVTSYIGSFASFMIGDAEVIKNARLRFADFSLQFGDMLLGTDFFLSHRIFVANAEHKLFMSYNGGPVFDLRHGSPSATAAETPAAATPADATPATATPATADASAANGDQGSAPGAAAPTGDAAATPPSAPALAREGAALASRRNFEAAIAKLSQAIDLSPNEAEYYFERANAYWAGGHGDLALPDFNRAVELKPDSPEPHLRRAEFEFGQKDDTAAIADLATVDRLVAPQADLRLRLANLYEEHDQIPQAIAQYNIWISNHAVDARMGFALASRCWSRALLNQDLPAAMSDCNTVMRRADKSNPAYAELYVDRALVRLRLGDYDKAIGDCGDALKLRPENAGARYVRGIAEARANKAAQSEADLAEAKRLAPKLADRFAHFGIVP